MNTGNHNVIDLRARRLDKMDAEFEKRVVLKLDDPALVKKASLELVSKEAEIDAAIARLETLLKARREGRI